MYKNKDHGNLSGITKFSQEKGSCSCWRVSNKDIRHTEGSAITRADNGWIK